ncbi:hypothetical protein DM826_02075 [Halonotius aquaticus]|uniref:Pyrrolo-quinoline quinone repeat domain-containing protein n=1 Tax=Halonotius aquaticus TaxID=2216978 RepID=A0A3A6PS01_9EURY|nr:PQQ-binding-like beta-propeller repeat protein [Halonotius aquaticus]RJX44428.1 hypothetical protein DM826_02075 [Halonotius aquaticus]
MTKRRVLLSSIAATTAVSGCLRTEFGDSNGTSPDSNQETSSPEGQSLSGQAIDWSQYGYNAANTAYVQERVGPTQIGNTQNGTVDVNDSFAIYDGLLIGGGNQYELPIELPNGSEIARRANHSMAVDNMIYLSGSREDGVTGWVGAFELDGGEIWNKDLEPIDDDRSFPMGSPAIADNTLYQATGDGILRAIDVDSGEPRWQYDLGGQKQLTPAIVDGVTYATGSETVAINQSGDVEWTRSFELQSSPVVEGERLYAVGNVGSFAADDSEPSGVMGLYSLDTQTGSIEWATELGGLNYEGLRNIAVDDSAVYVNTNTSLAAVEKSTGDIQFQSELDNSGEVIVTTDRIYTVGKSSSAGSITAHLKDSGEELWTEVISSPIMTEPVVSNNRLYVGAGNGLHVFIE